MVLETSQAEEYQLTCVAVKEGEDVQETLWDKVDFFLLLIGTILVFPKTCLRSSKQ